MNVKTDMATRLIKQLCSGSVEGDNQRAARIAHLEEFIGHGDYRVSAQEIVDAMLAEAPHSQQGMAGFGAMPMLARWPERRLTRLSRTASHF